VDALAADLSLRLRLRPLPGGSELLFARSKLVVDSAAAGIRPPFDAVYMDVGDERGLRDEAELARGLGFGGKMCIHPRQIETVEAVWAPSRGEIEWAQRVLAAHEEALETGRGAVALEGRLIDRPVVERAREILVASRREDA
jgi:citrate lyase beta subunit